MTDSVTECVMCGHRACARGRGRQVDHACPNCPNGTCEGYLSNIRQRAAEPPPPPPPASGARPAPCAAPAWLPDEYRPPPPPGLEEDPPADWLMAWASGWLAGYATGYDHGHDDGEQEYGASLAAALTPMRRAAAHGIDVALARQAWARQHQGGEVRPDA